MHRADAVSVNFCEYHLHDTNYMANVPDDIFTEPDFSPDTLANLGPLRRLAGVWESDQGLDVSPKAQGPDRRVFREHIRMEPIDPQPIGPQLLYGLRYHIHVNQPDEAITFHDQVGYWLGSRRPGSLCSPSLFRAAK